MVTLDGVKQPNVTGLTPNISILRTISLYNTDINIKLTVYQRPINNTFKETLRLITGNTNVDSNDRCISYGVSFKLWGQYPIQNRQATRNGGCDAIWGSQCSEGILAALQQSFKNIDDSSCGVSTSYLHSKTPKGCPQNNLPINAIMSKAFLKKGSFMRDGSSATDSSVVWSYATSDPSVDGDYNTIMKYFVFTYFVGRSYSQGTVDVAIACHSAYNTAT